MTTPTMETHPDIAAMRLRYERAGETPTAQVSDGLTFLSGLFLAMSPWVIGFSDHRSLTVNNLMSGLSLSVLAIGFATAYSRTHGINWVAPVIALWTVVAPWIVAGPTPAGKAIATNVIVGLLAFAFSLAAMSVGMGARPMRR